MARSHHTHGSIGTCAQLCSKPDHPSDDPAAGRINNGDHKLIWLCGPEVWPRLTAEEQAFCLRVYGQRRTPGQAVFIRTIYARYAPEDASPCPELPEPKES